jgi:hypothetical protein
VYDYAFVRGGQVFGRTQNEGVSLQLNDDGKPKSPKDSKDGRKNSTSYFDATSDVIRK